MIAIDEIGEGEPLVLLHGVGASRAVWERVAPRLAADRLVLTPDLPGFGESSPAGPGFDLEHVAGVLADGLAERAGQPFDLLGNSLGGAVALQLAVLRPELVRGLVLAAPAGFSHAPTPVAFGAGTIIGPAITLRRILGAQLVGSPNVRRALLWGAIAEPGRLSADDARTMLEGSRGSTRVGPATSAVLRADLSGLLEQLELPLGLIWGRRDRVVPIRTMGVIRAIRPDVVVETLADAAHVPQLERPTEFVAALRRVLARLPRSLDRHNSVRTRR
jgi:pimeloyl-ACP methyl ester carboxylesterase